ncbi:gag-pol polyprotein [Hordeum vulgare]|nr:gag-pol polyprotein [Hordeum vulgare]
MKLHFMMGLNNDIAKTIFTNTYNSLNDLYFGAVKGKQELNKAKASTPQTHFPTTKLHDHEHEDDGATTTATTEPSKEHGLEASDKAASKDDASIFGGDSEMIEHVISPPVMGASDDVPSSAFIFGDGDEMVEHGTFPSTITAFGDETSDLCHHIGSESAFTTSPIYDELPQFPCEESHNPHHLSEMSDSTICDIECTHFEGVSKTPPHIASEEVNRACEDISISKNLTSTFIGSSHLVLGPIYDDAPILDDLVIPLDNTMAMMEYDASPTWFHHCEDD